MLPDQLLDRLSIPDRLELWKRLFPEPDFGLLVSEFQGRVTGFIHFGPSRDEDAESADGEVIAIYVDPGCWSQGHGSMLLDAALMQLVGAGCRRATLWVLKANLRTVAFYKARGFKADGALREQGPIHERRLVLEL
jgi:ribosomal protein S18 acetylase RimI-like enzyme